MGLFDWWEDVWDQFSGNTQRRTAEGMMNSAVSGQQAAVEAANETIRQATKEYTDLIRSTAESNVAERTAATERYIQAMTQALGNTGEAGQIADRLRAVANGTTDQILGAIDQGVQQASTALGRNQTALNQSAGRIDQMGQDIRAGLAPYIGQAGQVANIGSQINQAAAPLYGAAQGLMNQAQPLIDRSNQMYAQAQPMFDESNRMLGQAGQMGQALNSLLAALGLGPGDPSAALALSPMYQLQQENQARAMNNALSARGQASGTTAARMLAQGDRELMAQELEKNVGRLSGLVNQGMQASQVGQGAFGQGIQAQQAASTPYQQALATQGMGLEAYGRGIGAQQAGAGIMQSGTSLGANLTDQAARAGMSEYLNSILSPQLALGRDFASLMQDAIRNRMLAYQDQGQRLGEAERSGYEDVWKRFNATGDLQNTALQNQINAAGVQAAAAQQAAQLAAQGRIQAAQNTQNAANAGFQSQMNQAGAMAQQPSWLQQILPIAVNWGLGQLGNIRSGGLFGSGSGASGPSGLTGYPASTIQMPRL